MATIEQDPASGNWRIRIYFEKKQYFRSCDTTDEQTARTILGTVEETNRLVKRQRLTIPDDTEDIAEFLVNGGKVTGKAQRVERKTLKEVVMDEVIKPVVSEGLVNRKTKYFINPTGRFVVGGPMGDSGLTGRKIIVDTYGGMGRHGGGAFSGKDPSKVDRSACYFARYIAKNVVAAKLARRCEVQLAYAIGVAKPVSLLVDTFGTGVLPNDRLSQIVADNFDARPGALIAELNLRRPIFSKTAAYGHFGRSDKDFTWERTNKAAALRAAVGGSVAKAGRKSAK